MFFSPSTIHTYSVIGEHPGVAEKKKVATYIIISGGLNSKIEKHQMSKPLWTAEPKSTRQPASLGESVRWARSGNRETMNCVEAWECSPLGTYLWTPLTIMVMIGAPARIRWRHRAFCLRVGPWVRSLTRYYFTLALQSCTPYIFRVGSQLWLEQHHPCPSMDIRIGRGWFSSRIPIHVTSHHFPHH